MTRLSKATEERDAAVILFAGDVSDGVELIGEQFTAASALQGNAVCTLPDPPAEIRAPAGTLAGVSGFQIQISRHAIHTPGDQANVLIAMNPAALKAYGAEVEAGGLIVVNADALTAQEWEKAGWTGDPLSDPSLAGRRVLAVPFGELNRKAVARMSLSPREAERCKSFFALGLTYWLFERALDTTCDWIRTTYAKNPGMIEAGTRALKAGYQFADADAQFATCYRIPKAASPVGRYRRIRGNEALALGILASAEQTKLPLVFACFPQRPANELLHHLCDIKHGRVKIVQAEDDLAALQVALGASFGGALGMTATTGPGLSLQSEALGLAVMSELPCVIIDIQRAGPAGGMPSKTEQADLLHALHGRNGECPLIVVAPASAADGFAIVLEATRLALGCMTPVIVLADALLAQSVETWRVPALTELPALEARHAVFRLHERDDQLVKPWAVPGTPGLEHRSGGLERDDGTGNVSSDPLNHETRVQMRARKIALAADAIPALEVNGPAQGNLLVLTWGSTFGPAADAVARCQRRGLAVAHAHLRHLHPLPKNTGEVLKRYAKVLVPELNAGQLSHILRATFLLEPISMTKVQGRPFAVREIEAKIEALL